MALAALSGPDKRTLIPVFLEAFRSGSNVLSMTLTILQMISFKSFLINGAIKGGKDGTSWFLTAL